MRVVWTSVDSGDENAELASLDTPSSDGSDEVITSDENSELASMATDE